MNEIITFSQTTVDALKNAAVDKFAAVATAAREAIAIDRSVTVRTFADSLRAVTIGLGMNTCVLSAAVKAAKAGDNVEEAMADAAGKAASKARETRDSAKKRADKSSAVKAFASIEDNLFKLAKRDRSDLLVRIEEQRGIVATLVEQLKSAREELAELESQYIIEQKEALKTA